MASNSRHPEDILKGSTPRCFPTQRRIKRLPLSGAPDVVIEAWFQASQIVVGNKIPNSAALKQVKRLLYTYREVNATELDEIPPTDLYEHKVRLKEDTKPWSVKMQKRWPPHKKYWLDKTVEEGLKCGFFERTMAANGGLSDWNAQAILVDKESGECRVTFNYRNVLEDIPGCFQLHWVTTEGSDQG